MAALEIDWFLRDVDWPHFATIPLFTGVVGWLINWTGLIMLFNPIRFHGVRIPGMRELATVLPRKVQGVPGLLQGGMSYRGISKQTGVSVTTIGRVARYLAAGNGGYALAARRLGER